jgi:hypothetical protein
MEAVVGVTAIDTSVAGVTVSVTPEEVTVPCAAVIVVVPAATPVAMPEALIVAAAVLEDAHVTLPLRSCVVWLLNVPVAVYAWVIPAAIEAVVGVTAIETSTADVTVRVAPGEVTPLCVAAIVVVPAAIPVAIPEALMIAAEVFVELQATLLVKFWVVWLLKVPVAVYAWVLPAAINAVAGVTAIDTSTGGVMVSVAPGEVMPFCAAVIVVVPVATPVARPEMLIVAAGVFEEVHVTLFVKFWVVWLLNVPVAAYACVLPAAMDAVNGVTAMDTSTAGVTVSVTPGDVTPACVAVIIVVPAASPVATPEALMIAAEVFAELHVTPPVTFWVVWLL